MRRFVGTAALFAALSAFSCSFAAEPHPLAYASDNAMVYIHVDVAALYDAQLGEAIKKAKYPELARLLTRIQNQTGVALADLKSYTLVIPASKEGAMNSIGIAVARKGTDPKAIIANIKKIGAAQDLDFGEKGGLAWAKSKPNGSHIRHYKLVAEDRVVILDGLDPPYLNAPENFNGLHAKRLEADSQATVAIGVHFAGLPEHHRKADSLGSGLLNAKAIFESEAAWITGKLEKDRLDWTIRLDAKTKANAIDALEFSDDASKFLPLALKAFKRGLAESLEDPKAMGEFVNPLFSMISGAKFAQNDSQITGTATLKLDRPWDPLVAYAAGAGLNANFHIANSLRQLGIAMHNFHDMSDHFPMPALLDGKGDKGLSWRVQILPFIEEEALYKKFNLDEPWDSKHNSKVFQENPMPSIFAIPGTKNLDDKKTHIQVFTGNGAIFEDGKKIKITFITDGTSNTAMTAVAEAAVEWTKPDDILFDANSEMMKMLRFDKLGKSMIGMADGSVRKLKKTLAEETLKAIITRAGGEVYTLDDD